MMKRTETYALFVRFESDPKGHILVGGNDVLEAQKLFALGLVNFVKPGGKPAIKLSKRGRDLFDGFFRLPEATEGE